MRRLGRSGRWSPRARRRLRWTLVAVGVALLIAGGVVVYRGFHGVSRRYLSDGDRQLWQRDRDVAMRRMVWLTPLNLGPHINTKGEEYDPFLLPRGWSLYFTRGRAGENADVAAARYADGEWQEVQPLAGINTAYEEMGAFVSRDEQTLFFASNRPGGVGGYDLWTAPREGDHWGTPVPVPEVNSPFDEFDPCLSPDGGSLYFSSNRPAEPPDRPQWQGTIRAQFPERHFDIWVSTRSPAGGWSAPRPFDRVNTPHDEGEPLVSADGNAFYFTSNRPDGFGGYDIWRMRRLHDQWLEPLNLGAPVNSPDDEHEPALSDEGMTLLFSSNRPGGEGAFDLYASRSRELYEVVRISKWDAGALLAALRGPLAIIVASLLVTALALFITLKNWDRVDLLYRCVLVSLILHGLLLLWFNSIAVSTRIREHLARVEPTFRIENIIIERPSDPSDRTQQPLWDRLAEMTADRTQTVDLTRRPLAPGVTERAQAEPPKDLQVAKITHTDRERADLQKKPPSAPEKTIRVEEIVVPQEPVVAPEEGVPKRAPTPVADLRREVQPDVKRQDLLARDVARASPPREPLTNPEDQPRDVDLAARRPEQAPAPAAPPPQLAPPAPQPASTAPEVAVLHRAVDDVALKHQRAAELAHLDRAAVFERPHQETPHHAPERVSHDQQRPGEPPRPVTGAELAVRVETHDPAPAAAARPAAEPAAHATLPLIAPVPPVEGKRQDEAVEQLPERPVAVASAARAVEQSAVKPSERPDTIHVDAVPAPVDARTLQQAHAAAEPPVAVAQRPEPTLRRPVAAPVETRVEQAAAKAQEDLAAALERVSEAAVPRASFEAAEASRAVEAHPTAPPLLADVQLARRERTTLPLLEPSRPDAAKAVAAVTAAEPAPVTTPSEHVTAKAQQTTAPERLNRTAEVNAAPSSVSATEVSRAAGPDPASPPTAPRPIIVERAPPTAVSATLAPVAMAAVTPGAVPRRPEAAPIAIATEEAPAKSQEVAEERPERAVAVSTARAELAPDTVDRLVRHAAVRPEEFTPPALVTPTAVQMVTPESAEPDVAGPVRLAARLVPSPPPTWTARLDVTPVKSENRPATPVAAGSLERVGTVAVSRASVVRPAAGPAARAAIVPVDVTPEPVPAAATLPPAVRAPAGEPRAAAPVRLAAASPSPAAVAAPIDSRPDQMEVKSAAASVEVPARTTNVAVTRTEVPPERVARASAGGVEMADVRPARLADPAARVDPARTSAPADVVPLAAKPQSNVTTASIIAPSAAAPETSRKSSAAATGPAITPPVRTVVLAHRQPEIETAARGDRAAEEALPVDMVRLAKTLSLPADRARIAVAAEPAALESPQPPPAAAPDVVAPRTVVAEPERPHQVDVVMRTAEEARALPSLARRPIAATAPPVRATTAEVALVNPAASDGTRAIDQAAPLRVAMLDTTPRVPRLDQARGQSAAPQRFWRADIKPELMYELRSPEQRRLTAIESGASKESEEAVERALTWLAANQNPDGSWGAADIRQSALTGLALLAFLGAGYTHKEGSHAPTVGKCINWYLRNARPDGDLRVGGRMYGQGMSTIAICEAHSLTKDPRLKPVSQNAVGFIVRARNSKLGGWRYQPQYATNDTSVLGWQIMALKSGELTGIEVPQEAYAGGKQWLKSVSSGKHKGLYGYANPVPTPPMTAEGMVCMQFMGQERDDPQLREGADYLMKNLPKWTRGSRENNLYYWYYGTLACYQMRDPYWSQWNARLRDMLVMHQVTTGKDAGSWSPDETTWGHRGGRIYSTAMATLCLEVYYRYLPLYQGGEQLAGRPPEPAAP